jgi:hypothetical protein
VKIQPQWVVTPGKQTNKQTAKTDATEKLDGFITYFCIIICIKIVFLFYGTLMLVTGLAETCC